MATDKDRRIAHNTIFLYLRMFVTMGVSVYTSRVILNVLGAADYGIYNVVGGVVMILAFLNATLGVTTQRFLNYEMGVGDQARMKQTFAAAWKIHSLLALLIIIVGETVGLWFVNNYLVITPERMVAANWVYQFSLVAAVFTVLTVPFNGAVFAHERMDIFAIIQLTTAFLKLGIVLMLLFVKDMDSLILFAALMALLQGIQFAWPAIFDIRNFKECGFSFRTSRSITTDLLRYSGADLTGNTLYVCGTQGVLIIINRVGGTLLNAAAGVATTICGALNQFGQTIIMSFRPQIISEYAAGNVARVLTLLINCSKFSVLLFSLFAVPVFLEMDYVLLIWLKNVPAHATAFCRLTLISSTIYFSIQSLAAGIHATGRILKFSVFTGLTYVLNLPMIYAMMRLTDNPDWAYIVPIFQLTFNFVMIGAMLRNRMPGFQVARFFAKGLLQPALVAVCASVVGYGAMYLIDESFLRLVITSVVCIAVIAGLSWVFLLSADIRAEIKAKVGSIVYRKNHIN